MTLKQIEQLARDYMDDYDRWNRDQSESDRMRFRLLLSTFIIYLKKHWKETKNGSTERSAD